MTLPQGARTNEGMVQDIRLYLGAHKTATTHLNGILRDNREALTAAGVALSLPGDLRQVWLPRFFEAVRIYSDTGTVPDTLACELRAAGPETGRWILAEENLPGTPGDLATQAGLYPDAAPRLATLRALFPEARLTLFFSLRAQDRFLASLYAERLRSSSAPAWPAFWAPLAQAHLSWADTVARFTEVLAPGDLVLWRYEDFRALLPALLVRLTGIRHAAAWADTASQAPTRPSPSRRTLALAAALAPALGEAETRKLIGKIDRVYGVAAGYAPFRPFPPATAAALGARYDDDVADIRARWPGIEFPASQDPAASP